MGGDPRFCFNSIDFGMALIEMLSSDDFEMQTHRSIVEILDAGGGPNNIVHQGRESSSDNSHLLRPGSNLPRFSFTSTAEDVLRMELKNGMRFYETAVDQANPRARN